MLPLKLFFDADTLIAGSASQTGASFLLLQLCEIRILRGLTCRQVIAECRRNLQRKLPLAEPIFNEIVKRALSIKKNPALKEQNKYHHMAHPKDLPILTSAITNRADYLVTFNTKHYFPDRGYHLVVLQPGEMLQKIRLILTHLESMNGP
ncbi:MAG: PIN domain-containing protein [Desulfobacterales bacterium]|jgi:predicted nucleic acid-binding protein